MFRCIVVAEGEFSGLYSFATPGEREAFGKGVGVGANLYGAGSCAAHTPADVTGLEGEGTRESLKTAGLIRKHLPGDGG